MGSKLDMSKPRVIACIPAFIGESSIGAVIVRNRGYVEVPVCDDGSRGLTGAIAGGLGSVVFRHELNGGKGADEGHLRL